MNCRPYRRRVFPLSLVIVSTYSYVDTILPGRYRRIKVSWPDGYERAIEAGTDEGLFERLLDGINSLLADLTSGDRLVDDVEQVIDVGLVLVAKSLRVTLQDLVSGPACR